MSLLTPQLSLSKPFSNPSADPHLSKGVFVLQPSSGSGRVCGACRRVWAWWEFVNTLTLSPLLLLLWCGIHDTHTWVMNLFRRLLASTSMTHLSHGSLPLPSSSLSSWPHLLPRHLVSSACGSQYPPRWSRSPLSRVSSRLSTSSLSSYLLEGPKASRSPQMPQGQCGI